MRTKTLGELAKHVNGRVIGDENIQITSVAPLPDASEGDITFLSNVKYNKYLTSTKASAVIVANEQSTTAKAMLITDDPYYAFCRVVEFMFGHRAHNNCGISTQASIAQTAQIGQDTNIHGFATICDNVKIGNRCQIYPGVFIGPDTIVGDDCIIYPNAVIFENCVIGNHVIIQSNASVGQDGFGFATHNGVHHKIPHIRRVILEDDVEIGANAVVERGSLQDTVIGRGCKIGDLVAIGHGAKLGSGCLLVPQVGIAGTAQLGQYCVLAGQSAVVGHIKVGNMVMVGGQSAVINDVPDGQVLVGSPAIDANKAKRAYALIEVLPEMKKAIKHLQKRIDELETQSTKDE